MEDLEALARSLAGARRVAVLTGAGVSAESGVPTFRGAGGLWRGREAMSLATPEAFQADPEEVWEFYDWRRVELSKCLPNPGYHALAELEGIIPDFTLATQNVDGLHRLAGSRNLLELHGNIWEVRCVAGCAGREDLRAPLPRPLPPRCSCGAPLRPGVVWFGESLPWDAFQAAQDAAARADVFLVVGTSGVVEPAASLARVAAQAGAVVAEFNPEETPLTSCARFAFRGKSGTVLARLVAAIKDLP